MRQSGMKRCLAAILTAALVFTSVEWGWFFTSKATGSQPSNSLTITIGQLLANNYEDLLSEEEMAILKSEAFVGTTHTIIKPTANDNLTAVDSDNKAVYAKNFTTGNYTWYPQAAQIVVNGVAVEDMGLTPGSVSYDNTTYDAKGTFQYTGDGYTVVITYNVYVSDVENHAYYMNIPFVLADAINNMNAIKSATSSLNTIVKYVAPELEPYVDGTYPIQFTGRTKQIVESWLYQKATYNQSELSYLISRDTGYNNATAKIKNILAYGAQYRDCVESVYSDLSYIVSQDAIKMALGDQVDVLNEIIQKLSPAATSGWDILGLDGEPYQANLSDTALQAFDALATAAIGKSQKHEGVIEREKLWAGSTEIECNVNRYNVSVTVVIKAVTTTTNTLQTVKTATTTVNLASGATKAEVEALIASNGIENATINAANTENPLYAIDTEHYVRSIETTVGESLTTDGSYTITYAPKIYRVNYTDSALSDVAVPYGTVITFPLSDVEGQTYEYRVAGEEGFYEEGAKFRVVEDVAVSRTLGKAKTPNRIYDIVVSDYQMSGKAAAILNNLALDSKYIYVRMAEEKLVTLNGLEEVVAISYDAGYGMTWVPATVFVKNGTEVVQTITTFDANGKAAITADDFTTVEAVYKLKVDITNEELLDALNLPKLLVDEAKQQLADLKTLAGYEADLDQITGGLLDMVSGQLGVESQAAIAEIIAQGCNAEGVLLLSTYIDQYKALQTDAERLAFYYNNDTYAILKAQAALVARNMGVIVNDPALPGVLNSLGKPEYIEKLEGVEEKLNALTSKFPAKNEKINVNNGAFEALLAAILADGTVPTYTTQNGLYLSATFTKTAPSRALVSVTVQVADGNGNIANTAIKVYEESFARLTGMSSDDLEEFLAKVAVFEAALSIDKAHYTCTVVGSFPSADTELSGNISVIYTWSPNTYTLKIDGEADQTFSYDNRRVTLPASGSADYKYYYTVGNRRIEVTDKAITITLTAEEFEALYGTNATYTLQREKVDVKRERTINLLASLNQALVEKGLSNVASFVPFEDENGNISIVLRLNAFDGNITGALETIVTVLINQSYVGLGGATFKDANGIYVNTLVGMLLNSGISSTSLNALIDNNGNIKENMKDKVSGQTVIMDAVSGIPTVDQLGGFLMETTFSITTGEAGMPLYVSLQDYDANATELKKLDNVLNELEPYAVIELKDGAANVTLTVPEKAHELFLAAMLLEGEISLSDFTTPSFVEMVDYVEKTLSDSVIKNEEVTADTFINTIKMLSSTMDMSGYKGTLTSVLNIVRKLLDDSFENPEITATNVAGQDKDLYTMEITCPTSTIIGAANLPEGIAILLVGDVAVPVNARLTNCNTDYTAAVIDLSAADVQDKVDLVTDKEITVKSQDSIVILLDDVDVLTAKGAAFVDLNGKKVAILNAQAAVTVFDSSLSTAKAGTIGLVNGLDNITLTAGTYTFDAQNMLPEGYVQNNGVVSNRYYSFVQDADGNITVEIAADFLNIEGAAELKAVAIELAVDLILNGYTWAGATVTGEAKYDLYEIEVLDVIASYKGGLKSIVSTVIEEIDCDGIEGFVNDLVDKLTDFEAIQAAIEKDTDIVQYTLATKAWDVVIEKADSDDYITANVVAGKATERIITLKVAGEEEDKKALAALCEELADVFGSDLDIEFVLNDLTYDAATGFTYEAGVNVTAKADLSKKEYVALIGIIMANGMDDPSEMVAAINKYFEEGVTTDIVAALEDLTIAQMITSLKKANGVELVDMMEKLGVEDKGGKAIALEVLYKDVLSICYKLVNALNATGSSQTLGSYGTGEFGTYNITKENWKKMNIDLTVLLANKVEEEPEPPVVEPPVISDPIRTDKTTITDLTVEGDKIIINVGTNGASHTAFLKDIGFEATNNGAITYKFSDEAISLVQTGETLTITATNEGGTDVKVYTIIVLGDVSGDGQILPNDATIILKNCVGNVGNTINFATNENAKRAALLNETEGVDPGDATIVLKKTVGKL